MTVNKNNSLYGIFTNKITGKKLVFYPCPKNANSSAKLFFAKHIGIENKLLFLSDKIPEYKLSNNDFLGKTNLTNFLPVKQPFSKMPEDYLKCCIIRDPIKRFISAYKNRILFHKDETFKNHSVDEVIEKLKADLFENLHFLPQSFFLGNNLKYFDYCHDVSEIKDFERNINFFFKKEVFFPKIQTGGSEINLELNKGQVASLKEIYFNDFLMIKSKT